MELKPTVLHRVLEALTPTLSGELDRVVQETRESLEQEFQQRLQTAVREAEAAATESANAHLRDALAEAKEATRKELSDEFELQFRQRLETETAQLKSEASADHARLQEQLEQWRIFAETQRQLAEASSQPEILSRFLRLAEPFADRLAVYVAKAGGLGLWKARGKMAFPEIISKETADPEYYFKLITIRGNTVAAIYAATPFKAEPLDFLATTLERAIEIFGLKLRAPVLKPAGSETQHV